MAMNGTITTWFKDKGFGFIKDENGENRYFHVIKVANPDLIKKDAAVTFEPTTNNKGAVGLRGEGHSGKQIYLYCRRAVEADLHQIPMWCTGKKSRSRPASIKKTPCCRSGCWMNSIRPKATVQPGEMRSVKKLAITTFQGTTLIFRKTKSISMPR